MRKLGILLFSTCFGYLAETNAQVNSLDQIAASVQLDSVVVTAQKQGFDVRDFIRLVQADSTFSTAFRRLRTLNWSGSHEMSFYDTRKRAIASFRSQTKQKVVQSCREMQFINRVADGNFYKKNGEYRFITANLYDRVFFTHGRVCTSSQNSKPADTNGLDHYYAELKHFIFEPGEQVDLPFIGSKTDLFAPELIPAYDFQISADSTATGRGVYVFSARIKPDFLARHPNRTIIRFMETRFERPTLQVLERSYQLAYNGLAFSFDVDMLVRLGSFQGTYYPAEISYRGKWDIPMHPEENARFSAVFRPEPSK